MKYVGEVSGSGGNSRHSEKYSHFIHYIFSCEHIYLYFCTAVRWLHWLSLAKLIQWRQLMCTYLSRDVHSCFISCKNPKQYCIFSLQCYIVQPFLSLKEIPMPVHLPCYATAIKYHKWFICNLLHPFFSKLHTAAVNLIFCSTSN